MPKKRMEVREFCKLSRATNAPGMSCSFFMENRGTTQSALVVAEWTFWALVTPFTAFPLFSTGFHGEGMFTLPSSHLHVKCYAGPFHIKGFGWRQRVMGLWGSWVLKGSHECENRAKVWGIWEMHPLPMGPWAISLGHNFYCNSQKQSRLQMAVAMRCRYQVTTCRHPVMVWIVSLQKMTYWSTNC